MNRKTIFLSIGILTILLAIFVAGKFFTKEKDESEIVSEIMEYASENYLIYAYTGDENWLYFEIDDTEDYHGFQEDIAQRLDNHDLLDKYELEIKQTSSDEQRTERLKMDIEDMIFDYLDENNLNNIDVEFNDDSKLDIKLHLSDDSNMSAEELNKMMEDFLDVEIYEDK
ncbi:hypothetical protein [Oceanobacillus neutriphilus]|uniref:Stage III sporulation protein AH n=1 Tax=Oceanobacillus neutriphilus TaxID=531815 RepID=A0ABQ2P279_9BACI|nr:hypothetical protein [Oceanobacillus neutriphilus]GGP16326.1 hypothetical protein GCM10011346_47770 [Oceanobacillus neutriphilus]